MSDTRGQAADRRGQAAGSDGPADEAQIDTGPLPGARRPAGATAVDPRGGIVDAAGPWARGWRWIILAGASSTALLAVTDASGPLRALITVGFLVVCPGMSLTRLIDLRDALAEMAVAIAMSVALTGLVGGTLLYFGLWSPGAGSAILIAIALGGLAANTLRERRDVRVVVRGLASRVVGPVSAATSEPTTPDVASATAPEPIPEPAAAARAAAWRTPPRPPAEQFGAPDSAPPDGEPASRLRRTPGDTVPDFLLRAPTSVIPVADDFFDDLIRQVEGDR
jgi:hypothetical protein